MKSETKWLIIPPASFILSLALWIYSLGTVWGIILPIPMVLCFLFVVYAFVKNKIKITDKFLQWMNSD